MDEGIKWKIIFAKRFRRQLPLDIEHCSPIALRNIILDVKTPDPILERIAQVYYDSEDILRDLVLCPNLSETTLAFIALTGTEEIKNFISTTRVMDVLLTEEEAARGGQKSGRKKLNVQQIIMKMSIPQKVKLALSGAKEARGLLVRESSKIIALSVLQNPRLTIGEVEFFAKSANLSEDVIRKIGNNAEWTRKYAVVSALVYNPKTPVGISLGFVNKLTDRDLGILEKSRGVPEGLRTAAKKKLAMKKMGKG
jgi:hypothetical protein